MRLTLLDNNLDLQVDQNERYDFILKAAKGEIKFEQIKEWLRKHVK